MTERPGEPEVWSGILEAQYAMEPSLVDFGYKLDAKEKKDGMIRLPWTQLNRLIMKPIRFAAPREWAEELVLEQHRLSQK